MNYVDFEVEVSAEAPGEYAVEVRSEFGEASGTMRLPFDSLVLQNKIQALQIALLRSGLSTRGVVSPEEAVVKKLGQQLFESLFSAGPVLGRFEAARDGASGRDAGVRVKLRISAPELASLPWEYLYDPERDDYLGLSISTPVVRYVPLPRPVKPLAIKPPIRILGLIASSLDLPSLDTEHERQRLDTALESLVGRGLVELKWLPNGTWRDVQAALLEGPWHVFHFIGHGGFDEIRGEGFVLFSGEDDRAYRMSASDLGRLLGDHDPMRLAILNSCEGARADNLDVFSSTAATLVKRGTPGVVAMQYPITDRAAIEFSRAFYSAIGTGSPVDTALAVARKSVSLAIPGTLEWGTPVLYLRTPDGVLFDVAALENAPLPATPTVIAPLPAEPALPPAALAPPPPAPAPPPVIAAPSTAPPAPYAAGPPHSPADAGARAPWVSAVQAPVVAGSDARAYAWDLSSIVQRGWRSGHIQTVVGALGGGVASVWLLSRMYWSSWSTFVGLALLGLGMLAGAFVMLRISGADRRPRTIVALAVLLPIALVFSWSAGALAAVLLAVVAAVLARTLALWDRLALPRSNPRREVRR